MPCLLVSVSWCVESRGTDHNAHLVCPAVASPCPCYFLIHFSYFSHINRILVTLMELHGPCFVLLVDQAVWSTQRFESLSFHWKSWYSFGFFHLMFHFPAVLWFLIQDIGKHRFLYFSWILIRFSYFFKGEIFFHAFLILCVIKNQVPLTDPRSGL